MKHLKTQKELNEASENLNISDVRSSNHKMIGKNTDFEVIFNTQQQRYYVYYKGKHLISKEKFVDVKSYLD
jgi:hypothetical protein